MSGERLKETTAEMDALMERLQTNAQNVNRLVPQRTELQAVANELTAAAEDAIVYKMIGPVLVRQSKSEALQTVNKRLDYVQRELGRCEAIEEETMQQFRRAAENREALQKKVLEKQKQQRGRV